MLLRGRARPADEHAMLRADHEAAGANEQPLAHVALERRPQLLGSLDERHIRGMLEVRFPDDARATMGRAVRMRRRITIEPKNAKAAARELARRGTSHRAE